MPGILRCAALHQASIRSSNMFYYLDISPVSKHKVNLTQEEILTRNRILNRNSTVLYFADCAFDSQPGYDLTEAECALDLIICFFMLATPASMSTGTNFRGVSYGFLFTH